MRYIDEPVTYGTSKASEHKNTCHRGYDIHLAEFIRQFETFLLFAQWCG